MPAVQRDRLGVGVPDVAPDVDPRIPPYRLPAPAFRLLVAAENPSRPLLGDAVGMRR
jgi:hypothetical protein